MSSRPSSLRTRLAALAWLVAAILPTTVLAQAPGGGPGWSQLDGSQRRALAPLQDEWSSLDAARKQKWLELAERFDRLPPAEQARVQDRMDHWARMSPRERDEARLNYREARQLSPQDRQARWEAYQSLQPEERERLGARGKQEQAVAPPRERRGAIDGTRGKVNTVPNPFDARAPRTVAPSMLQARPGATTLPINERSGPPLYQQPGLPKIAATPEFVDKTTLLPRRGPQAAPGRPDKKTDR